MARAPCSDIAEGAFPSFTKGFPNTGVARPLRPIQWQPEYATATTAASFRGLHVNELHPAPLRFRHLVSATALALSLLATGAGSAQAQAQKSATRVVVDAVREETYSQTLPIIGRFVARRTGEIAARINGAVEVFNVEVGDRVKQGDVLAVLDKARLDWEHELRRSQVSQSAAQLKTKKQEIKLLRQELARLQSLKNSPAFSQARLDDKLQQIAVAESAAAEANAMMGTARANQKISEIALQDAEIKAPYAGVVVKRHTALGAYVAVGAPVVTLLDDETMEIEADVPADNLAGLIPGAEAAAVIARTHSITTTVRAVIPEENPRTRTRAVRFTPIIGDDAPAEVFAANQSVLLHLPAGARTAVVTVHKDAVVNRKGKAVVVLAADGKAAMRTIELGPPTGSRFIVTKGLKPGDLVVVRGNERLLPGTPITFDAPGKSSTPAAGAKPSAGTDGARKDGKS